jgi:hypothetical protein
MLFYMEKYVSRGYNFFVYPSKFAVKLIIILPSTMARQPNVIPPELTEISIHFFTSNFQILNVLQDEQDAPGQVSVAGHVDPPVAGGPLDRDVPAVHGALLARVENHPEAALDHDAVVDALDAVQG